MYFHVWDLRADLSDRYPHPPPLPLPLTTRHLNPLDKSVFGPLDHSYNLTCSAFMAQSPNNEICRWEWPGLLREAYRKTFTINNICSGFRACGIHPYNPSAIPTSAYSPSLIFDVPQAEIQPPVLKEQPLTQASLLTALSKGPVNINAGENGILYMNVNDGSTAVDQSPVTVEPLYNTDPLLSRVRPLLLTHHL